MRMHLSQVHSSAVAAGVGSVYDRLPASYHVHRLPSLYYSETPTHLANDRYVHSLRKAGTRVYLESINSARVDMPTFARFLAQNEDVLAGVAGIVSPEGPEQTLAYFFDCMRHNIFVVPQFDASHDVRWLRQYLAIVPRGSYIALSCGNARNPAAVLDRAWNELVDQHGHAVYQVHGNHINTPALLHRYPWASAHSAAWLRIADAGQIFHPNISEAPVSVARSRSDVRQHGAHFLTMSEPERTHIASVVAMHGFTLDEVTNDATKRRLFCMRGFYDLGLSHKTSRFAGGQTGIFG